MFDEPTEHPDETPNDPAQLAREKLDQFRMHAELAAVFEGVRKFEAQVLPKLDPEIAREIQRTIGRLEKSRVAETPVLPPTSTADASAVLAFPDTKNLSTNDYHIHRRPGEVMMIRWLAGDEIDAFYERLQAHFDAALNAYRDEQRGSHGWKQDPKTLAYLEALDKLEVKMADRYLREIIREKKIFVLSTQAADEMDILHLSNYLMEVSAEQIVGTASAPPDEPSESDRAWFFKLFSLRGVVEGVEQMCFFTYLQKADESAW